ncbi:MAG: GIY-YIG nuclease family protein, partial [Nitrososphaeraceae archaeon]|nr:GIY-YIG nuclease family protein [Nitrososphaeraceae archaeon]
MNIYLIINTINGKFYLGRTNNLQRRKKSHFNKLKNNKHYNSYLQKAYNKYGRKAFKFICYERNVPKEREQFWLDLYFQYSPELLYNISKSSTGGNIWNPDDYDQICDNISKGKIKFYQENEHHRKGIPMSKSHYENFIKSIQDRDIKGKKNPFFGKTHSDKQKEKWRKERKGR